MTSEPRPSAAPAADRPVDPARPAGRDRLATVRRDFFLDPAARLTEQERALMTAMLDDLVASIADAILAALPDGTAGDGDEHEALIARLSQAGLLDRPELVALLLRRSDEQRLAGGVRRYGGRGRSVLVERWAADEDSDIAAAAMALAIARGRRRDRHGQPRLLSDDLPADEAAAMTRIVAAGLSISLAGEGAQAALLAAAETLLAQHAEAEPIEALLAGMVRLIEHAGRLDDALAETSAAEGEVALLSAMLARRGAVPEAMAWEHLVAGGEGRMVMLARIAGLGRPAVARLLADLGPLTGIADPAVELARFDALDPAAVEYARAEWRLPPAYRVASEKLRG